MSFTRNKNTVLLSILESLKNKKHSELLKDAPACSRLLVFGMTTIGGWYEKARDYMVQVSKSNASRTESTIAWSVAILFVRQAVRLLHINALCHTE